MLVDVQVVVAGQAAVGRQRGTDQAGRAQVDVALLVADQPLGRVLEVVHLEVAGGDHPDEAVQRVADVLHVLLRGRAAPRHDAVVPDPLGDVLVECRPPVGVLHQVEDLDALPVGQGVAARQRERLPGTGAVGWREGLGDEHGPPPRGRRGLETGEQGGPDPPPASLSGT